MATAEEFREKGYVFFGYFPPELSSCDPYPDYIKKEVEESVAKIQSHQTRDSVTFAFMTDLHFAPTYNHSIRLQRTMNAYKEINKRTTVDMLILGGDLGANGNKDFAAKAFREFRAHFDGTKYFPVLGNHDDNSIWEACIEAEKSEHHFTHEELYALLFNHLPRQGAEFDEKHHALYYLYNDKNTKTRYIFLDTNEPPEIMDDGKLRYPGQHIFAHSQEQLDWLTKTALHFEKPGWSAVIIGHSFLRPGKEAPSNETYYLDPTRDIVNACREGGILHKTYYNGDMERHVEADFTTENRPDIICMVMGHHHFDAVDYGENGLPYIVTAHGTMYNRGTHIKYDGTKTEISFDVITVDKKTHTIYITKVGDGEDRVITY